MRSVATSSVGLLVAFAAGTAVAAPSSLLRLAGFVLGIGVLGLGVTVVGVSQTGHRSQSWVGAARSSLDRRVALAAVPVLVLVNAVDVKGYFLSGAGFGRYLLVSPFIAAVLIGFTRPAYERIHLPDVAFKIFVAAALGGAFVAYFFAHPVSTSLPLAIPACLGFTYVASGALSDSACARLITWLEVSLYVYVGMHVLAALGLINSGVNRTSANAALLSNGSYTHEKSALLFMALHLAWRRRGSLGALPVLLGMAVIFRSYPAGTYAAAGGAYVLCVLALRLRRRPVGAVFAAVLLGALLVVIQLGATNTQFGSAYFAKVGKTDNVGSRVVLWDAAEQAIRRHPVFGSVFAGEATVRVHVGDLPPVVPPHNDYLEVLLLGGGVALYLFVAKILTTGQMIGRTLRLTSLPQERRIALELVAVGLTVFLVVLIFNPVLLKVSLSAFFFSLLGLAPALCASVQNGPAGTLESADPYRRPAFRTTPASSSVG